MAQFEQEGIEKLSDSFDSVESMIDTVSKMLNKSKAYTNFSGISDDLDGTVKFIFVHE